MAVQRASNKKNVFSLNFVYKTLLKIKFVFFISRTIQQHRLRFYRARQSDTPNSPGLYLVSSYKLSGTDQCSFEVIKNIYVYDLRRLIKIKINATSHDKNIS